MRAETACRINCSLKRKGESHTSPKEHPFVSSIILTGRVLCKVTPAMSAWVLSSKPGTGVGRGGDLIRTSICDECVGL